MTDADDTIDVHPDYELIGDYLARELDADKVAEVERRLASDPDFRRRAAPLIALWTTPLVEEAKPVTHAELEIGWDDFTRRVRFAHQRRKSWRRRLWILGSLALLLGVPAFVMRDSISRAYRDFRDFETVAADTGWITMRDTNEVKLGQGARLHSSKRMTEGVHRVRLEGSARFRVFSRDTSILAFTSYLSVKTRGGTVFSGQAEFSVNARGDTTDVEVHAPSRRRFLGFFSLPTTVLVRGSTDQQPIALGETQAARMIRGRPTERTKR